MVLKVFVTILDGGDWFAWRYVYNTKVGGQGEPMAVYHCLTSDGSVIMGGIYNFNWIPNSVSPQEIEPRNIWGFEDFRSN